MPWKDRAGLVVASLSLIVSFLALAVSKDVVSVFKKSDLVSVRETLKLSKFSNDPSYLDILSVQNVGSGASGKLILIVGFDGSVPKYEVSSNEDVRNIEVNGGELRVAMDRLSSESKVKILMYSQKVASYRVGFVDDDGVGVVRDKSGPERVSMLSLTLMLVMILSLLLVVWISRRLMEGKVLKVLEVHQNSVQDRFREIQENIGNLESRVGGPITTSPIGVDVKSNAAERLFDFADNK